MVGSGPAVEGRGTAWLCDRAQLPPHRADALAAVGPGALFSSRLLRLLLNRDPIDIAVYITTWVQMIHTQITN
ncbi:MAG: hypothetical protein WCC65_13070 [Pseudonocardiaceae bacterium]